MAAMQTAARKWKERGLARKSGALHNQTAKEIVKIRQVHLKIKLQSSFLHQDRWNACGFPWTVMKYLFLFLIMLIATSTSGVAQTFDLGNPPVARVDLPRSWSPNETNAGAEANSPDGRVYVSVEAHEAANDDQLRRVIQDTFDWLRGRGVQFDPIPPAKPIPHPVYGDVSLGEVTGRDREGKPTAADIITIMANPSKVLVMLAWYDAGAEREHRAALISIVQSIRPAGR
jgi:hypothetical protein